MRARQACAGFVGARATASGAHPPGVGAGGSERKQLERSMWLRRTRPARLVQPHQSDRRDPLPWGQPRATSGEEGGADVGMHPRPRQAGGFGGYDGAAGSGSLEPQEATIAIRRPLGAGPPRSCPWLSNLLSLFGSP